MPFRTEIKLSPSPFRINHGSKTLFTGSCFTNNIGERLRDLRFPVIVNPFGVVYNPLSVKQNIDQLLARKVYTGDDLEYSDELWFSFDHHSSFSDTNKERVLDHINNALTAASDLLYQADFLLLTFGTAWVYRLRETGGIVCNCHKIPPKAFNRELLSVDDVTNAGISMIKAIRKKNPSVKIIFTISPVRHWKDGAHGNQVSKAVLLLAVENIMKQFGSCTDYFPAYELMLDDLRDYRFYDNDLVHPDKQAVDYIWDKFSETYFDEDTRKLNMEISRLIDATRHRVMFEGTESHKKFVASQLRKVKALQAAYPGIDFTPIAAHFNSPDD
ncbi:MAG TPA: GSCFA domain-containing protein [Bacteroidales bacterium]|nr:GSCFA domain-containing protein [Bacteroidales bacterium]